MCLFRFFFFCNIIWTSNYPVQQNNSERLSFHIFIDLRSGVYLTVAVKIYFAKCGIGEKVIC